VNWCEGTPSLIKGPSCRYIWGVSAGLDGPFGSAPNFTYIKVSIARVPHEGTPTTYINLSPPCS
jgi:hypothetical protein